MVVELPQFQQDPVFETLAHQTTAAPTRRRMEDR
jgi:hypothetical protein